MIVMSSLNSGDSDATLTDFPLEEIPSFLLEFPEENLARDPNHHTPMALETWAG